MKKIVIALAAVSAMAMGCQPPASGNNKEILAKLEQIEKKIDKIKSAPGKAPVRKPPKPQTAAYNIPTGTSAFMGAKDAKVTVTMFSDFECPWCGRAHPLLKQVMDDKELKGKVKVVFKHFPLSFHKNAKPASYAAMAAQEQGNDKFWAMADKLYEGRKELTEANFEKWAKEAGLNVSKFKADMKNNKAKYDKVIAEDMKVGQTQAKVRGTPSLFVNGWSLKQRSVEGVKALAKSKKLL